MLRPALAPTRPIAGLPRIAFDGTVEPKLHLSLKTAPRSWPGAVGPTWSGGAIGTADAIATAPFRGSDSYAPRSISARTAAGIPAGGGGHGTERRALRPPFF